MNTYYVDSSALVKLVIAERESTSLRDLVSGHHLIVSALALTEVPRALRRRAPESAWSSAWAALSDRLRLFEVGRPLLGQAGELPPASLRSLDAVHLACAVQLVSVLTALVGYNDRLLEAAAGRGLAVLSPGRA